MSLSKSKKDLRAKKTLSNQALTRPIHDHKKESSYIPNKCTEFGDFLDMVGRFHDGHYLLMISKMDYIKHEEALTNIPWLCVFDFDETSFTEGLFYRIEDILRAKRGAVYPCTWKEPPNIQAFGTEWCFISGSAHAPGSSTPANFKMWYSHIQDSFEKHITYMTKLLDTVMKLTVIAFWPEDNDTGKKFHKVLSVLTESIRPLPQVVVIIDNPTTLNKSFIEAIEPDYTLFEKCEHIFHDLSTNVKHRHGSKRSSYELPAADGPRPTRIDNASAATFRDSMQVLYLDNPFHTDLSDLTASEEEETLFLKGGTLSWEAYYNYGPEHFYVARDICPVIVNDIRRDFIDTCNAGDVTIYHAPGAGGTTLGQNIIWNLHELTPCVQVRSDTLVSSKKIAKQINTLHTETHLPIVVLFDGSSNDNAFDFIRRKCNDICVIFIHLKRVSAIGKNLKTHEYFLPGALSKNEAKRMGPKFIRYCGNDSKKKDQIQKLVDEVVSGQKHHLIEFGLVTFRDEFTGVGPYVYACLEFDNQSKEFDNYRKVLGYLSLVQVFGQGIMPCQLFGTMLGKSPDYTFHYEKFHRTIKEFTVPVDSDFTRNSVRICHYLIAKEILDQVLSNGASVEKSPELKMKAKQNLKSFVLEFIEDLRIRQDHLGNISRTVFDIILQTFIYREDRSNQNQQGKGRSKFSRLIESIPSEQPFTERLQVMETLAKSFPGSPSLWAHLGRAYAILRLNEREKTESYFRKAIDGCKEQRQSLVDIDEKDTVLSYVFHMYGTFYLRQIRAEIEQGHSCNEIKFQDLMRNILALAKTACRSFDDSRRLRFAGYQESFGCFGEIDVRLAICEFLKRHYRFKTIQELLEISKNIDFKSFVEESLSLVQQLFLRCYNVVDQSEIKDEFYKKIALYNTLFRGMIPNKYLDSINLPDNIHTRGVKIAAIKLKYGNGEQLGTINDITAETDIKSLISLLEQNIDDSKTANELTSKTGLDHDLLDWIHVIRLANQRRLYTIEDVLVNVRWWFKLVRSPYARLYRFVLLFLYAVPLDGPCNQEMLREAVSLKKDKEWYPAAKTLSNPERPREWLGTEHGIRCLLPGETFKCDGRNKFINDEVARYRLRVMKGTIGSPNTYRNDGYIRMDVAGNVDVPVNVHFCPVRTKDNLVGQVYAGRRVEFTLAFTAQSGFEAYNVMTLEKSACKCCGRKIEIISIEKSRTCQCGETVENDVCVQIRKKIYGGKRSLVR
ncbi:sterile alpha motif domain-containing protein 9-like [Pecten maximus]|uniref:sterile alpha motif domain-containing protein 9-like n=1 Tax=Pecten maximus TaxID=6579 RepID=UPI00145881A2|nr:sterile alpha motif domain-containing protein 9-like [Pecten maximus]